MCPQQNKGFLLLTALGTSAVIFPLRETVVEIGADRHDADSMGWCMLNLSNSEDIGPNTNTEPHEKSDAFIHGGSR